MSGALAQTQAAMAAYASSGSAGYAELEPLLGPYHRDIAPTWRR
jgi:hypothetical protein